jgi:hypothetical protein
VDNKEMPIYVRIEEYRDVLDVINMIKSKIQEAKQTLGEINRIKNEEDSELERWHFDLEEVEKKMDYVDKALFEPEAL